MVAENERKIQTFVKFAEINNRKWKRVGKYKNLQNDEVDCVDDKNEHNKIEQMVEDDQLSASEAGFLHGYLD